MAAGVRILTLLFYRCSPGLSTNGVFSLMSIALPCSLGIDRENQERRATTQHLHSKAGCVSSRSDGPSVKPRFRAQGKLRCHVYMYTDIYSQYVFS